MTIREWAENYCVERGMFPSQAKAVVDAIAADAYSEPMQDRWETAVEGYPKQLLGVLATMINGEAVTWIDANCPKAWYRGVFAGEGGPST